MGTIAGLFRKTEFFPMAEASVTRAKVVEIDELAQFKLRALPNDDVYFFVKRVDNSRLVRQADPTAKGQCWSAIGAACVLAALAASVMAPQVGARLLGYKIEKLRAERTTLIQEIKMLDVQEASLLSPSRLDVIAEKQKLTSPRSGQVVHLPPKGDGGFAKIQTPRAGVVR